MKAINSTAPLLAAVALGILSLPAHAEIPPRMEADYSEAVLSYNANKYGETIKLLDALVTQSPDTMEFLELKALALKGAGKPDDAAGLYQKLIELKTAAGADEDDVAPYNFELGVIRFREGKLAEARDYLTKAADGDFNEGPSHFFMGVIDFKAGQWSGSEEHFHAVTSSSANDLKPASHFYLAQLSAKTQYPAGATHNLLEARNWSRDLKDNEDYGKDTRNIAAQVFDASEKALAPLDHSQTFGSVAGLVAYDSNVLSSPTEFGGETSLAQSTLKTMVQFNVGYMTSPLKLIQWVPNLSGSGAFHLVESTKDGEFSTVSLANYLTYKPLSPFNGGLKIEGSLVFQNSGESRFGYHQFSRRLAWGPFFKYELANKKLLGLEVTDSPTEFSIDDEFEADNSGDNWRFVRDGHYNTIRLFYQNDPGRRFWNPTFSVQYVSNDAHGIEYTSKGAQFSVRNQMYLSDNLQVGQTLSWSYLRYAESEPSRIERALSLQGTVQRRLTPKLSLLGELMLVNQNGEDELYTYSRVVFSGGVSYSL